MFGDPSIPYDTRLEVEPKEGVKECLTTDDRASAEQAYTMTAHDYESNPVGSRDWTLFYAGWKAAKAKGE